MRQAANAVALLGLVTGLWLASPGATAADGSQTISERLHAELIRFVQERAPRAADALELPPLEDFELPGLAAGDVEIRLSAAPTHGFAGNVPITVSLRSEGAELKRGVVTARLRQQTPVLVAARPLSRGTRIARDDLRLELRDAASLPSGVQTDPDLVVGRHAKRGLSEGALLREGWVERRPLVRRGQLVALRYESGALRIDGRGKAREDGRVGDVIRVLNVSSKREVSGRLGADGVIHVAF